MLTSNYIPYGVMSADLSFILLLQPYTRKQNILTNQATTLGVCSVLIPQELGKPICAMNRLKL